MVLNLQKRLPDALEMIYFQGEGKEFVIHRGNELRHLGNTDEILQKYADAKWQIVELLNQHFKKHYGQNESQQKQKVNPQKFALENWLFGNKGDEVAFFLNEAGANALHHGQYKAPAKLQLWLGKKGFVIGIEQQGEGFDAKKAGKKYEMAVEAAGKKVNGSPNTAVNSQRGGGKGFAFFKSCKNRVFFDDAKEARSVFIQVITL